MIILVTGGTLENIDLKVVRSKKSIVPRMLKQARTGKITIKKLMMKESRWMGEDDRKLILENCMKCAEKQIVITHGTFTMAKTAAYLAKRIRDRTVILTGAAVPFANKNSDAMFNLGCATTAARILPPGVYITMNGQIFKWDNVRKNLKTGKFEKVRK